jgi:hydroxymethylpyrimidine/phosphomethylpyrimidine kinase
MTLLTIAGTDPSSAAGIQVDLQVFRDYGFHGASVITAVVWQNTIGVRGFRALEADDVIAQLDAVLDDLEVTVVKVGMVPTARQVDAIVERIDQLAVVWDPVLRSGSGEAALVDPDAIDAIRRALPDVTVLTPNVPEAARLSGIEIETRADAHRAAGELLNRGPDAVLLKTGHLDEGEDTFRDVFASADGIIDLEPLSAIDADVRGTGCQLSSAIAAEMARGAAAREACEHARRYLHEMLRTRRRSVGKGRDIVVHT